MPLLSTCSLRRKFKADVKSFFHLTQGCNRGKAREQDAVATQDNKSMVLELTSGAASDDQLADFIIDKDEQGIWECAEPPVGPGKTHARTYKEIRYRAARRDGLVTFWHPTHLRGYILRATSMPGQ